MRKDSKLRLERRSRTDAYPKSSYPSDVGRGPLFHNGLTFV